MSEIDGAPYDLDPVGLTLTGSGSTVVDPTVPPPGRWQFIARPWYGGPARELTQAKTRRMTVKLQDPSDVSFSINGRHPESAFLQELVTDIHVLFNPDPGVPVQRLFRGRVGNTTRVGDENATTKTVPVVDYRAILNERRLWSWNTLDYSGLDQADIIWALIAQTQGNIGGDLGISKGWTGTTPTGIIRADQLYEVHESIGERIKKLAQTVDGFDWDVLPTSDSALSLQVYYPERGTNRGEVLLWGGNVTTYNREVVVADYRNAISQSGAEGLVTREVEATDLATRLEGRWDGSFGDTNLLTQQQIDERATWQASESQVIQPTYTLKLKPGWWRGRDHIWVGDYGRVVIQDADLQVDDVLKVFEMTIDINDGGSETVHLTVGGPKPDPAFRARRTDRRLLQLETH